MGKVKVPWRWRFLTVEAAKDFAVRQELNGWQVVMSGLQVDLFPGDAGEHGG